MLAKGPGPRGQRGRQAGPAGRRRARPRHLRHARARWPTRDCATSTSAGRRRDARPRSAARSCAAARRRGCTSWREDLPADRATRDAVLLAAMGSPDAAGDRRHGRRAPADVEGRRGVDRRDRRRRRRRLPVPAGLAGPARGLRQPELRQHARRGRAVRDRERPRGRRRRRHRRPDLDGEHRHPRDGATSQTPGGVGARTTATPGSTACPARTRRSRSSSPTSPARPAARCCPPGNVVDDGRRACAVTCIDNGMPVVCLGRIGPRAHRRRDAGRDRGDAERDRRGSRRSAWPPAR